MSTTSTFFTPSEVRTSNISVRTFATDRDVLQLEVLLTLLSEAGTPPQAMRDDFDERMARVRRAMRRGELDPEYEPNADGTITIPMLGDPAYLQTALYWSVTLKAPLERVVEACRHAGDNASRASVQAALDRIEHEDRMCQTDRFFVTQPLARPTEPEEPLLPPMQF